MRFMNSAELLKMAIAEAKVKEEKDFDDKFIQESIRLENEESLNKLYNIQYEGKDRINKISNQGKILKEALITEALLSLYEKVLSHSNEKPNDGDRLRRRSLVQSFVSENGGSNLLNNFKFRNLLLSEYCKVINNTHKAILEKNKECQNEEIIIQPEEKDKFLSDIENKEADKVAKVVATRVLDSIKDFIKKNEDDKEQIKAILDKAQAKIDSTVKTEVQEAVMLRAKQETNKIYNRSKSLYQFMVESLCKNIYKSDILKEMYVDKEDKINMESVMDTVTEVYVFLELCNTLKVLDIDESYIKKFCEEF